MSENIVLFDLIRDSAHQYLDRAGPCGRLLKDFNKAFERTLIETTVQYYNQNISLASKALGISRTTLYDKMKQYNIS